MNYKAVLFDFDGVIGMTMDDNFQAWAYALTTVEVSINKIDYFLLEGLSARNVAKKMLSDQFDDKAIDLVVKRKEKHYLTHHTFEFYPDAKALINYLKKKQIKLAVVSGASAERLKKTVSSTFLNKFDSIVTGDRGHASKPSPEPYLQASKELSISPEECLVIENAPLGIESAKKAGMTCIAIASTLENKYLLQADRIVKSIIKIREILEKGGLG